MGVDMNLVELCLVAAREAQAEQLRLQKHVSYLKIEIFISCAVAA